MQEQQNKEVLLHLVALQDQVGQAQRERNQQVEQDLQLQRACLLWQLKRFDEVMEAYSSVWTLTLFTRDESTRLIALLGLGRLCLRNRRLEQASFFLEDGLELAREQANRWAEAECLNGLAHACLLKGEPHRALHLAEQARTIPCERADRLPQTNAMNVLAVAYAQCGRYEQAEAVHREALLIAREWDAREMEAAHLSSLGNMRLFELAQPEQGIANLKRSLALYKEQEDGESAAEVLSLLAAGMGHLQQWGEALRYADEALARTCGLKWLEVKLHFTRAAALSHLGRREEALRERAQALASLYPTKSHWLRALFEDHHTALVEARTRGDRREEAAQLLYLADDQVHTAGLRGYIAYYEQAFDIYHALGDLYSLGMSMRSLGMNLALFYFGMGLRGKRARALAYVRAGLAVLRETSRPRSDQANRTEKQEQDPPARLEGEAWLARCDEEQELDRLKKRWGEPAYLRAWTSSERYYCALLTSFLLPEHVGRAPDRGAAAGSL